MNINNCSQKTGAAILHHHLHHFYLEVVMTYIEEAFEEVYTESQRFPKQSPKHRLGGILGWVSAPTAGQKDLQDFLDTYEVFYGDYLKYLNPPLIHQESIDILSHIDHLRFVRELHLPNMGLSVLPKSIEHLKKLEILNVCDNHLYSISECILSLPNLKVVYITNNQISSKDQKDMQKRYPHLDIVDESKNFGALLLTDTLIYEHWYDSKNDSKDPSWRDDLLHSKKQKPDIESQSIEFSDLALLQPAKMSTLTVRSFLGDICAL
jgi:hypothetical protein